jgi:hypothetical protein
MSDSWKEHDRPCPPCPHCGAEIYEKFWGNGGWVKTEVGPDEKAHSDAGCVKRLKARIVQLEGELDAWRRAVRFGLAT